MPFAQWLQSKMDQYGFSNYRIAKMAGVHQSTVANWLAGAKPQAEKEKLVRQSISEYEKSMSETDPGIKKDTAQLSDDDETTKALLDFARNGSQAQKEDVLQYIQFLMSKRNSRD